MVRGNGDPKERVALQGSVGQEETIRGRRECYHREKTGPESTLKSKLVELARAAEIEIGGRAGIPSSPGLQPNPDFDLRSPCQLN